MKNDLMPVMPPSAEEAAIEAGEVAGQQRAEDTAPLASQLQRPETAITAPGEVGAPFYVVFDTETTGLFVREKKGEPPVPADDPRQPHMASFAAILADAHGREVERHRLFVRPEGWSIDGTQASEINGLTDLILHEKGIPVRDILGLWNGWIDRGLIVTAFNAQFDQKVMRAELRRAGLSDRFEETKAFCLMRALDPYGAEGLPIMRGFIKLAAVCEHYGLSQKEAHDAMSDTEDALFVLQMLIRDGRVPEAKVHYHANHPSRA